MRTSQDSFVSYIQLWLVQSMSRECSIDGTIMRYPIHYKDRLMAVINRILEEYDGSGAGIAYKDIRFI